MQAVSLGELPASSKDAAPWALHCKHPCISRLLQPEPT